MTSLDHSMVTRECPDCEQPIGGSDMFSHLEEHVGPRVFEAVQLKCRDCSFSVLLSEQNLFSLMRHCAVTGHKGRKAEADWTGFVKSETRRLRQIISLGAKFMTGESFANRSFISPGNPKEPPTGRNRGMSNEQPLPELRPITSGDKTTKPPKKKSRKSKTSANSVSGAETGNQLFLKPHLESVTAKLASIPSAGNSEQRVIGTGRIDVSKIIRSSTDANSADEFEPNDSFPNEDDLVCGETPVDKIPRPAPEASEMETDMIGRIKQEPEAEENLPSIGFSHPSEDSVMELSTVNDSSKLSTPGKKRFLGRPRKSKEPKKPKEPKGPDFRDLSCRICQLRPEMGWTGKWNMVYHLFSHDNSVLPFKCGKCPYVTGQKSTMVYHSRRKSAAMKGCDGSFDNIQTEGMIARIRELLDQGFPEINWKEKFPPGQAQNGIKF